MSVANKKYQQLFLDEANEHLQALNDAVLKFEKNPDPKLAAEMMRSCHTIKGSAASMGYENIADLAHSLEDKLENIKTKKHKNTRTQEHENMKTNIDELFAGVDELERLVKSVAAGPESASSGWRASPKEVEGEELAKRPEAFAPITTIKVGVEKLDKLMNLTEEILVNRMRLGQVETNKNYDDLPPALDSLDRLVSDLQYNVMEARLVPVDQIFQRFPRMVRDLAKKEGKRVDLVISGSEIELDRTLLNQIGEPLVHLLRNAVDHGIEKQGTIKLSARREKGFAVIEVEDDGKGIDWEKVKKTQKHKNTRTQEQENMKTKDLVSVLFSGVTTSKEVSKTSGRGVGLTIVKQKVEEVGGKVSVESPVTKTREHENMKTREGGTRFTLELPLTLAIAQALLVRVAGEKFAVPVSDVDRLVRIKKEEVKVVADQEATVVAGEDVPLIGLNRLFNISNNLTMKQPARQSLGEGGFSNGKTILAILAKVRNQTIGFVVDEVLSEQDIIIKPLSGVFREQKGFSGATILGDGSVVLILDIGNLI